MDIVKIYNIEGDENYLYVSCDDFNVHEMLFNKFCFTVPGHRFMRTYKMGIWDGKIRLYDKGRRKIYKGLFVKLLTVLEANNIEYEVDEQIQTDFEFNDVDTILAYLKLEIENNYKFIPRKYQLKSILQCLTNLRQIIVSPTASGKSLIIYGIIDYFLKNNLLEGKKEKILVLVPTVALVDQMKNDFISYQKNDDAISDLIHTIYSGKEKDDNSKTIFISTWQSIYKLPKEYFKKFKLLLVDEIHLAEGKSIKEIVEKCVNGKYRYGFTGTLKNSKTSEMALTAYFGEVYKAIQYQELMEKNYISGIVITNIVLNYKNIPEVYEPAYLNEKDYMNEKNVIVNCEKRNKFIVDMASNLKNNTLILFERISQGKQILDLLSKQKNKKILYISGSVSADKRNEYRELMENCNDYILVASFGTTSTGINIKNIHNIIFASPYKSPIRVLQSIGRGLRKHKDKVNLKLYDIVDDLRPGKRKKERKNFFYKHWEERKALYYSNNFKMKTVKIIF